MKLFFSKPSQDTLKELIGQFQELKVSHRNVGSTLQWPAEFFDFLPDSRVLEGDLLQFRRIGIGTGSAVYEDAKDAVKNGLCFDLGWVSCQAGREFQEGDTFSLTAKALGIWVASFCRVLYVQEEDYELGKMFSIGIGTLPCHAATGEERISIFWNAGSGEVVFLIGSFSKPQTWLATIFVAYLRKQQNRFAVDAAKQLRKEVRRRQRDCARFSKANRFTNAPQPILGETQLLVKSHH